MSNAEIILLIADGTQSVSRIRKIAKVVYNVSVTSEEVMRVTNDAAIPTPHRQPTDNPLLKAYPDRWAILMEAHSFWVRVRRYWGDSAALELRQELQSATEPKWRALRLQFDAYINPHIYDRRQIDLKSPSISLRLELETLYSWETQRDCYILAYEQEMRKNPDPNPSARFPLPTPEYEADKLQKLQESYLRAFDNTFGDYNALIHYFIDFWRTVEEKRGSEYAQSLKNLVVHPPEVNTRERPFYGSSKACFLLFLRNLQGFQTKAPYRLTLTPPRFAPLQQIELEGAILKYGWQDVLSMVKMGIAGVVNSGY